MEFKKSNKIMLGVGAVLCIAGVIAIKVNGGKNNKDKTTSQEWTEKTLLLVGIVSIVSGLVPFD